MDPGRLIRPAIVAGLLLALAGTGCTRQAPVAPACIDATAGTVQVAVTNTGTAPLRVPRARPDIGCCRRAGLTVALTDPSGRDLDRCGFADNFDLGQAMDLPPGGSGSTWPSTPAAGRRPGIHWCPAAGRRPAPSDGAAPRGRAHRPGARRA
jgi:hypothetical protein